MKKVLPEVSIVVIGRNEGKNLDQCFKSISEINYPCDKVEIIYVDSKSKDDSVEIAKRYTDKIFLERSYWPTAGEAFNRGIIESSNDFIHITAGDIQLHPDYLQTAVQTLLKREDIQAVTGYFYEKKPKGWNKLIAYRREEDSITNDHYVQTPNGGTFRKKSLIKINGYDERIKKGQETELGIRFTNAGFKILYMHIPQGMHDFDLNSLKDMFLRYVRNGISSGHLFLLSIFEKNNAFIQSFRMKVLKQIVINTSLLILFFIFFIMKKPMICLLIIILYIILIPIYVLLKHRKKTKGQKKYFIINTYFSVFTYLGILNFLFTYFYLKIKGIDLMKPKLGLTLKKRDIEKSNNGS